MRASRVDEPHDSVDRPMTSASLWLLAVAVAACAFPREPEFNVILRVDVAPARRAVSVTFLGEDTDIIKDSERDSFELDERRLKTAVAVYTGRRPEHVFVRSPTPWGDLYVSYGWEQVSRTVYARRASAHIVDSEMVLVSSQTYENIGTESTDANASISVVVYDTVAHSWSSRRFLDVRREVQYRLRLQGADPAHRVELAYVHVFDENELRVKQVKVEASFSVKWRSLAQRGVVTQLWARRSRVRVRCEYEARLRGRVAVNFATKYKSHYFWGILIDELFEKNGINNLFESTELLEVCFYSDFKITSIDATSGSVLFNNSLFNNF